MLHDIKRIVIVENFMLFHVHDLYFCTKIATEPDTKKKILYIQFYYLCMCLHMCIFFDSNYLRKY